MKVAPLPYNFHDGGIFASTIGPRREVTLTVGLALPGRLGDHIVQIRFGGIENFDEVRAFFSGSSQHLPSYAASGRIDHLDYSKDVASHAHRLAILLEIDGMPPLTIRCRNINTWQGDKLSHIQGG